MERCSRLNFRRSGVVLLALFLCACAANGPNGQPGAHREPAGMADSAAAPLAALREYLGLPAGEQAARRRALRLAAADGDHAAALAYALALSVDRDSRANLEAAYERLSALLATPDPLPVALDTLVRLQLGQVIDRLDRMERVEQLSGARARTAAALRVCRIELAQRDEQLDELRGKLRALARIEQKVENGTDGDGNDRGNRNDEQEDNDANRQPHPSR